LKPSNVGFTRDGKVKIFDFGLAREILSDDHHMTPNTVSLNKLKLFLRNSPQSLKTIRLSALGIAEVDGARSEQGRALRSVC
jgi:serine/threonine protein kinase